MATQERWFPLPGARCGIQIGRRMYVNGVVLKVEITGRQTYVTVRIHKGFGTRKRVYRIPRTRLTGWTEAA